MNASSNVGCLSRPSFAVTQTGTEVRGFLWEWIESTANHSDGPITAKATYGHCSKEVRLWGTGVSQVPGAAVIPVMSAY